MRSYGKENSEHLKPGRVSAVKQALLGSNIVVWEPKPEFACPELSGKNLGPGRTLGYRGSTGQSLKGNLAEQFPCG